MGANHPTDTDNREALLKRSEDALKAEGKAFIDQLDACIAKACGSTTLVPATIFEDRNALVRKLQLLMQDQAQCARDRAEITLRRKLEEIYRAW